MMLVIWQMCTHQDFFSALNSVLMAVSVIPLVSSGNTIGGMRSGNSSSPGCSPVARSRLKSRKSGTSMAKSAQQTQTGVNRMMWAEIVSLFVVRWCPLLGIFSAMNLKTVTKPKKQTLWHITKFLWHPVNTKREFLYLHNQILWERGETGRSAEKHRWERTFLLKKVHQSNKRWGGKRKTTGAYLTPADLACSAELQKSGTFSGSVKACRQAVKGMRARTGSGWARIFSSASFLLTS